MLFIFNQLLNKRHSIKEEFRKEAMDFFLISFLMVLSLVLASFANSWSNEIDVNLPFNNYHLDIDFDPAENIVLSNLKFVYDFKSNGGNIYFRISELNISRHTTSLDIEMPKEISVKGFSLKKGSVGLIENKEFKVIYNESKALIVFHEINGSLDDINVNIDLRGNESFKPNGKFTIHVAANRVYSQNDRNSIEFNLGDYECKSICFGKLLNAEPEINNKVLKLRFDEDYYPKEDAPKPFQQLVTLNTYHLPSAKSKENLNNFYLSLLITSFVLFGEMLRKFIPTLRFKDRNSKR